MLFLIKNITGTVTINLFSCGSICVGGEEVFCAEANEFWLNE